MTDLDLAVIAIASSRRWSTDGPHHVVLLSAPRRDPIFCSLLDGAAQPEAGFFDIEVERLKATEQSYVGNTASCRRH